LPQNDPAPAVQRRARTQQLFNAAANDDVLRWNTADGHLHLMLPHKPAAYSAKKISVGIANDVQAADDQDSMHEGIYKSALTQKLFIVPQANVLTGTGQKHLTAVGSEDVAAEKTAEAKGAKSIMSAAKKSALKKKKDTARQAKGAKKAKAQKLDAAPYMRPMPPIFGKEAAPLLVGHPQPFSVPGGVRPMGAKQVAHAQGLAAVANSDNEEYGQSGFTLAEVRKREERVGGGWLRARRVLRRELSSATTPTKICSAMRTAASLMRVYSFFFGNVCLFFTQLRAVKLPSFLRPASSGPRVEAAGKTFSV